MEGIEITRVNQEVQTNRFDKVTSGSYTCFFSLTDDSTVGITALFPYPSLPLISMGLGMLCAKECLG